MSVSPTPPLLTPGPYLLSGRGPLAQPSLTRFPPPRQTSLTTWPPRFRTRSTVSPRSSCSASRASSRPPTGCRTTRTRSRRAPLLLSRRARSRTLTSWTRTRSLRSGASTRTSGPFPSVCTSPSFSAQSALASRDGTRPDPTEPTCRGLRRSGSPTELATPTRPATSGSSDLSTLALTSAQP